MPLNVPVSLNSRLAPKSIAISPENRICTACLHDEEGGRRCVASIREAVLAGGSGLAGPCHLGLDVVVARLSTGGVLFGCGFVAEKRSADARESAVRGAARLRLPVADPPRAFEGIPRLEERDVPRLVDLVGTAASEMVAFSGGAPSRHNGTREATVRAELPHQMLDLDECHGWPPSSLRVYGRDRLHPGSSW